MYFIVFLTLLLLIFFTLGLLLYIYPVKVAASLNSGEQQDVYAEASWLRPFLEAYVIRKNSSPALTVKLLGKRVYEKQLLTKSQDNAANRNKGYMDYIDMARSLKLEKAKLYASYGFEDPSITGMLFGAIDFIPQYIELEEYYNNGDFAADRSFYNIAAEAEFNAALSLATLMKRKMPHHDAQVLGKTR